MKGRRIIHQEGVSSPLRFPKAAMILSSTWSSRSRELRNKLWKARLQGSRCILPKPRPAWTRISPNKNGEFPGCHGSELYGRPSGFPLMGSWSPQFCSCPLNFNHGHFVLFFLCYQFGLKLNGKPFGFPPNGR